MAAAPPPLRLKCPSKAVPDCPLAGELRDQESLPTPKAAVPHHRGESPSVDEPSSAVGPCAAANDGPAASPSPRANRSSHCALRVQASPLPGIHPVQRLDPALQPGCGTNGETMDSVPDVAPYRSLLRFDRARVRHPVRPPREGYPANQGH